MKEESTLEMKETFTSLQEEVDIKSKKLNKVSLLHVSACALVCNVCTLKRMINAIHVPFMQYAQITLLGTLIKLSIHEILIKTI